VNVLPAGCSGEPQAEASFTPSYPKKDKQKGGKKQQQQQQQEAAPSGPPPGDETIWLEPLPWMMGPGAMPGVSAGKITCPKCRNKLGSFKWLPDEGKSRWPQPGWQQSGLGVVVPAFCVSRKKLR